MYTYEIGSCSLEVMAKLGNLGGAWKSRNLGIYTDSLRAR